MVSTIENARVEEKTTSPLKNAVKGASVAAGSYLGFEAIKGFIPNFQHEEKGKNLDQKM